MTLHPRLTRAVVALVKRFETFQPQAEPIASGGWSIGYGHARSAREGARVSEADAEALLIYDLDAAARTVERALFAPVSQRQFEALTALCFNLGEPAFLSSSALARVNAGAELEAADEIERWRRAELGSGTQVVDALVRRRAAEKAHFLGLPEGEATWPSAQLRPLAALGGEGEPVDLAAPIPASAALAAADGVQARLRRLIPEDVSAASPADGSVADPSETTDVASTVEAAEEAHFRLEPLVAVEPVPGSPIAWEPTPPPFDASTEEAPSPVHELHRQRDPEPPVTPEPVPSGETISTGPTTAATAVAAPRRLHDLRLAYALAGLIGVALFAVAVAMILTGRTDPLSLGVGALGALLAAPGLYGSLGGGRGPTEPVDSDPVAGQTVDDAAPFRKDPPDTK